MPLPTRTQLKSMVLCNIDGIGDVRLSDVAEVEMTDNADDSLRQGGQATAPCCCRMYKSSTVVHLDGLQRQQLRRWKR